MHRLISICIPTLNRSEFLCKALNSIFEQKCDLRKLELCISNNASEQDYSVVYQLLANAPPELSINYVSQPVRLPLDEHMFVVKNLATSPYIYFLGDDDFFLDGQLTLLIDMVERETPDLAIFNGTVVDEKDLVIGQHFNLPAQRYSSITTAFNDLRDKGMFGSVLVKAEHLGNEYFKYLFGTSHGYGCYWFALLSEYSHQKTPLVLIPSFPLVALRMAAKSYSQLEVYYRDIPYEISVYQRHLPAGQPQILNQNFKNKYIKKVSSVRFLTHLRNSGFKIKNIKNIDPNFYSTYRLNISISDYLVRSGCYKFLKKIFNSLVYRRRSSQ